MVTFALLIAIVAIAMLFTITVAVFAITLASPVLMIVGIVVIDIFMCASLIGVIRRMMKRND